MVVITLRPAPFVAFPFGLASGVDDVNDRHDIGGLVDEIVEDVPHDKPGVYALFVKLADDRKGVRVALESGRAIHDPGQPVGGSVCPGLLGDVPSYLTQ